MSEFIKILMLAFMIGPLSRDSAKCQESDQTVTNGTDFAIKGNFHENKLVAEVINKKEDVLKTELVKVAGGFNRLKANAQNKADSEQRIIALAILNMMMDLEVLEQMDGVIAHCTLHITLSFLSNKEGHLTANETNTNTVKNRTEDMTEFFGLWLQSLVTFLKKEPQLNEVFERSRNDVRENLPASEPTTILVEPQDMHSRMVNSYLFRRTELNEIFIKQSSDYSEMIEWDADHCKRFLLARTLIDLAKRLGLSERLNQVYRKTLDQVAKDHSTPVTDKGKREKLFLELENNIKEDGELNDMVKACERTLHLWYSFRMLRRKN